MSDAVTVKDHGSCVVVEGLPNKHLANGLVTDVIVALSAQRRGAGDAAEMVVALVKIGGFRVRVA